MLWYTIVSIVSLLLNALPLIICRSDVSFAGYSVIPLAFAVCSVVYAGIAFRLRGKGNLFTAGKQWIYHDLSRSFSDGGAHTETEEYEKEFRLSALIYCITIPTYITMALLAGGYRSALTQALGWTVVRGFALFIVVILPVIVKRIRAKKQQQTQDEAARIEQERRESMGQWK